VCFPSCCVVFDEACATLVRLRLAVPFCVEPPPPVFGWRCAHAWAVDGFGDDEQMSGTVAAALGTEIVVASKRLSGIASAAGKSLQDSQDECGRTWQQCKGFVKDRLAAGACGGTTLGCMARWGCSTGREGGGGRIVLLQAVCARAPVKQFVGCSFGLRVCDWC
jgi:hypothetical protein